MYKRQSLKRGVVFVFIDENTHQIAKNTVVYLNNILSSTNQAFIPKRVAISIIRLGQKLSPGVSLTNMKQGIAKIKNKAAVN